MWVSNCISGVAGIDVDMSDGHNGNASGNPHKRGERVGNSSIGVE